MSKIVISMQEDSDSKSDLKVVKEESRTSVESGRRREETITLRDIAPYMRYEMD